LVSLGEKGAMLFTQDKQLKAVSPRVEKKSTVGAGDSMVAGFVLSLSQGKIFEDALRYGVACGTAATMNYGTELCNKKDADALFQKIVIGSKIDEKMDFEKERLIICINEIFLCDLFIR
jgi:6-phosphofructokinase 2